MCDDPEHRHQHGGGRRIRIAADLFARNDVLAGALRARLAEGSVVAVNLIGSPGAGKTTLLERTLRALPDLPIAVIEGDQATDRDAQRIAATERPVVQVNTGAGCHLDATMIDHGLDQLAPAPGTLVVIENVGNLVCPAMFDLGERAKVVVMSVTEGEDKPLKYPHVFRAAQALVLTKCDLLPHLDFDPAELIGHARHINPDLRVFPVAAKRGEGLAEWCGWLRGQIASAS